MPKLAKYMELLQFVLGCSLVFMGAFIFFLGWRLYHSASAQMARFIRDRLDVSMPFLQEPGVIEMLAGGSGAAVGVFLILTILRGHR